MNEIRRGIRPRRIGVAALLVAGMAMTAHAQAPDSDRIERQRIAAQRGQANAAFAQAERECRQRFAVTACMDEARGRQREALASLRRQSALLDEAERRQRAAARAQSIRGKLSAEEARQQGAGRTRREVAPRSAPERPEAEPRAIPPRSPTQAASAASAQREATEARNRARHEARQAQVQSHREAAERRAAQRLQRAMPAAPLPPASAPRR